MAEENLVHCIYTSSLTAGYDSSELDLILKKARHNNEALDVSGMLLFDEGSFFQILEGEEPNVMTLFEKISLDERHEHMVKIIFEPIEERSFYNWSMGVAHMTRQELAAVPGLNDFFADGNSLAQLDAGRAKSLLAAFRDGRYRSAIN
ncbi:MAG: BLUF domain-containing protein [Acidimicrobiales bacterium]